MSLDQHWNTFSSYTLSTFQQSQKQQLQTQSTSIPSTPISSSDSQHSGYSTPSFSPLSSFPISVMNHPRILFDKINSLADAVSRAYNDPPFSSSGTSSPKEELPKEEKRERRKSLPGSEGDSVSFLDELAEENTSSSSSQSEVTNHPNRPAPVRSKSSASTITSSQSRRSASNYITESPKTPTPSTINFPNSPNSPKNHTASRSSSSSSSETYRVRHSRFFSISSSSSAQSSKYDSVKGGSKATSAKGTFSGGQKSAVTGADNGGGLNMKYVAQSIRLASEALEAGEDVDYAIDCYLSSLDYLISAFPLSSPGSASHSIQLKKHSFQSKLFLLLAKLNPSSRGGLVKIPDGPLTSTEELRIAEEGGREVDLNARKGIWSIIPSRISTPTITDSTLPSHQNQSSQEVLIPCEACGNTVGIDKETLIGLAGEQFRLKGRNSELQVVEIDDNQDEKGIVQKFWDERPKTWQEAVISIVIHLAIFLRQSPILYLFSVLLTSMISYLLYLDAKFLIRRRVYIGGMRMFNGLAESDKEGKLSKALGEGTAVFWEALLKGASAFSQAEPFQPPESWVINSAIADGRPSSGPTDGSRNLNTPVWDGWGR